MLKQLSIFRKREDLTQNAFRHYWRNRHPDVVTRLPGIRRYVQNHVTAVLRGEPAWDGIAEVWFDDIESMRVNAGNPVLADIRADEANFISAGSMVSLVTEEHTFVDDATGSEMRKLLALVKRRPDLTAERFQENGGARAARRCWTCQAFVATFRPVADWGYTARAESRHTTRWPSSGTVSASRWRGRGAGSWRWKRR